ncbi:MAG: hypothetical protein ABEJ36_03195 [Candidatus Nanosalina sp.]
MLGEGSNYGDKGGAPDGTVSPETAPGIEDVEPGYWDPEIESMLEEAEYETGLDMKDNFSGGQKAELPEGEVAGTSPITRSNHGGIEVDNQLFMDEDLPDFPDEARNEAFVHEYVHSLDHQEDSETLNGLMDYAGFSDEAKEIVYDYLKFGSEAETEAATEFIALNLNPDGEEVAGTFYPMLTSKISQDLFEMGEHPDYGIAERLEETKREVAGDLYSVEIETVDEEGWDDPYSGLYEEIVDRVSEYLEDDGTESVLMGYDPGQELEENFYDSVVQEYDPSGAYTDDFSEPMDAPALDDPVASAGADEYTNRFGA